MTPEQAVIGACLLDSSVIRMAVEHVMPSDFDTWQGEQIFTAIINLHSQHLPVDVVTVASALAANGSMVEASVLHKIMAEVPSAANVEAYAAQVREASVRRGLKMAALRLAQDADSETVAPGVALAAGLAALKAVRDDAPFSSLHGRTMAEIMAEPADYDWVIKRLLERGDRLIMTGGEGSGKSMMMRQMALFSAAGIHPFWLQPIPPVNVVVIDRENSAKQWRRKAETLFRQAQRFGSADPGRVYLECDARPMDITRDTDLGYIHRVLDQNPCDVLFLGPLYKLVPRAIQTDDDAAPLLAALDSLRERGVAIVTEAHSGHQRDKDLRPLGSSAFLRWPEFGRGLRKDPAVPGRVLFEKWRGDRDERAFPQAFYRGGPVPWTAEGTGPRELEKFTKNEQPDGRQDLGF